LKKIEARFEKIEKIQWGFVVISAMILGALIVLGKSTRFR